MLVLGRKLGEKILIDGGIEIEVVKVQKGGVRLGIKAPEAVKIHREEVLKSQNQTGLK